MARNQTTFAPGPSARRHAFTAAERTKGGQAAQAAGKGRAFARGADPRRHALTQAECRQGGKAGFRAVMERNPTALSKVKQKIRRRYPLTAAQRRQHHQEAA